jgi:alpha-tubulin suppressor-like RCC1 family protein
MTDRTTRGRRLLAVTATASLVVAGVAALTGVPAVQADGDEMPGAPRAARSITSGQNHTCALLDTGSIVCWGDGVKGQLGNGSVEDIGDQPGEMGANLVPVDLGPGRTARAVSAGGAHTCALLDTAEVACWGQNSDGQLGTDSTQQIGDEPDEMGAELPRVDLGTGRTALAVTAGFAHTCALLDTKQVKCWGAGGYGRLGQGSALTLGDGPGEMGDTLPVVDLGVGRTVRSVTAGDLHTCALLDTNQVACWGNNGSGELGLGSTDSRGDDADEMGAGLLTVDVGAGRSVRSVSAGESHTCALLDNGKVACWGLGLAGRLGTGSTTSRGDESDEMGDALATVDLGVGRTALGVVAGTAHSCALLDTRQVKCWGFGDHGISGSGSSADVGSAPGQMGDALVPVGLGNGRTALSVTGLGYSACVVLDDLSMKCWGLNLEGQLGLGDTADRGDDPNEMGDALPRLEIGGTVGRGTLRPDGMLRGAGEPFVGNGVYNTSGNRQARTAKVRKGKKVTFTVRVQNDGNEPDTFAVRGTTGTKRFTVIYKRGSTNITKKVVKGKYTTPLLPPGVVTDISVTVTPKKSATKGKKVTAKVTVTSRTDTTKKDVVRATVTRR